MKENQVIKKNLLLHSCCAPCAIVPIKRLFDEFNLTLFFYNSNIDSKSEYLLRRDETKNLALDMCVDFLEGDYNHNSWLNLVRGLESLPERGKRCTLCYALRLRETALIAKKEGFDYFATTLTLSPYKDAKRLNKLGKVFENEFGVNYLESDFKKKDGYRESCVLSKEKGLYRQNYCGCEFSRRD